ncbi:hypothetical protein U9M48_000329 [Paspalum notatum var. saurae]|uniref:Uncharacterized protein n=1 Tax=Paspalum notatum var. saurae TaxID=547442 RepID=A0AAQ3PF50_PASNO
MFLIQSIDPHVPRPVRSVSEQASRGCSQGCKEIGAATACRRHSARRRRAGGTARGDGLGPVPCGAPAAQPDARSGGGGPAWQAVKPFLLKTLGKPFLLKTLGIYRSCKRSANRSYRHYRTPRVEAFFISDLVDASSTVHRSRYSLQEWSANTSYSEINCEREGLGYLSLGSEPKAMRRSSVKSTSSSPLASMILDACIRNMHRCKHHSGIWEKNLDLNRAMDKSEKCPVDASVHYKRSAALPRGAAGLGDER